MPRRIIILTDGNTNPHTAKTASSLIRYRREEVVGLLDRSQAGQTSGALLGVGDNLPVVSSLAELPTADTLLIGIAPPGGKIPPPWRAIILEAIGRGMDIVSGLHEFVGDDNEFSAAARRHGVTLTDVRKNQFREIATRQGFDDRCLRVLTVGHDCSVGKMVAAIEVTRELNERGTDTKFVATGQTGIMVEGDGCPIDCVVSDFVSGAAEHLVRQNQHHSVLMIEGQGSLVHPAYSAVTLGLLHGCRPDAMILCYEVGRRQVAGFEPVEIPSLRSIADLYLSMANVMHPTRIIAIAMNSRRLDAAAAENERRRTHAEFGLPVCDVIRDGPGALADAVQQLNAEHAG